MADRRDKRKPPPPCPDCGTVEPHIEESPCARRAAQAGREAAIAWPDRQRMAEVAWRWLDSVKGFPQWVRDDLTRFYNAATGRRFDRRLRTRVA